MVVSDLAQRVDIFQQLLLLLHGLGTFFISAAHEDGRRVHNLDSVRSAHHCRWAFTEPSIRWSILQGHPGRFSLAINPVCAEFLLIGIGHASCGVHGGHPMDHDIITGTEPAPHSHAG